MAADVRLRVARILVEQATETLANAQETLLKTHEFLVQLEQEADESA